MAAMDAEIDKMAQINADLQREVNQLTCTHKTLLTNITLEEAKTQLDSVTKEVKFFFHSWSC